MIPKKSKAVRRVEILRLVSEKLEHQFDEYSWKDMIDDMNELDPEEKQWAKEHTRCKAYVYN